MPNPSPIQVFRNGTEDITRFVVFAMSSFDMVGSATPGTGTVVCKDPNKELMFITGDEITLVVDSVTLWGGLALNVGKGHFFSVVDTTDLALVHDLQWVLQCTDFNIWMDKRVVRDPIGLTKIDPSKPADPYLNIIYIGPGKMGKVLREEAIPNYMDVPPGLDYTSMVDDTTYDWQASDVKNPDGTWQTRAGDPAPLGQQGEYWRKTLDRMVQQGGFEWWIDAEKRLRFHVLENVVSDWGFTDYKPDGVSVIGFREGTVREDGMQMVTDALVWGGHAYELQNIPAGATNAPVFGRYPDPPANDEVLNGETYTTAVEQEAIDRIAFYGRWQRAELHFEEDGYFDRTNVQHRAAVITAGAIFHGQPDDVGSDINGIDSGLNRPVWQVSLSWFAHDVPGKQHIVPGNIVKLLFYTMGVDEAHPLALLLPLRTMHVSFPTIPSDLPDDEPLTYVRFDGEFGISFSDSRYLWRFLRARSVSAQALVATVTNDSTTTVPGAVGSFFPNESPDGVRTQFTLPFSYMAGTTEVYLNGLFQRPRLEYVESSPGQGIITFATAPFADDTIWVVCRTGGA